MRAYSMYAVARKKNRSVRQGSGRQFTACTTAKIDEVKDLVMNFLISVFVRWRFELLRPPNGEFRSIDGGADRRQPHLPAKCQDVPVTAASRSRHKQRDRMMARVNYDRPPGYSLHHPSLSLRTCPSVGICPCPCFSSSVRPCRFAAPRGTPSQLRISAALQLPVMVRPVRRPDARPGPADRQHVYRPRHYTGLWKPIDPLASRRPGRGATTARHPQTCGCIGWLPCTGATHRQRARVSWMLDGLAIVLTRYGPLSC